jgi:hypothetical protein
LRVYLVIGFVIGAGYVAMLGRSFLDDHDRRIVVPVTAVGAVLAGLLAGWAFDFFVHYASQRGGPGY